MLRVRTDFTPSNYLTEIIFRSKSSRPNTIGSDTMYNEDLIKEAVQKELDNYNNNHLNNNQYTTVNKDVMDTTNTEIPTNQRACCAFASLSPSVYGR